jgi:hypothetical protein
MKPDLKHSRATVVELVARTNDPPTITYNMIFSSLVVVDTLRTVTNGDNSPVLI